MRQENFQLISREIQSVNYDSNISRDVNNSYDNSMNNKVVVFVSHSHMDHFDKDIFKFEQLKDNINIQYVFSSDVKIRDKKDNYYFIYPDKEKKLGDLSVRTFSSTDQGVSYLVSVDNINIFHAGDLNWWYWYYESTPEELAEYERDYKSIIQSIVQKTGKENIDIAFFPVDSRLKDYYYFGGEHFIENLKPKYFIPMHFGSDYSITGDFALRFKNSDISTEILTINSRGQEINIY